jgi:DNA polymerase III subunit delta'
MSEVFGHEDVRRDLGAAVRRGTLPGSLLIHGPVGVGRQTVALWLARLLVCEEPDALEPCGRCHACRLALDLQHPDVHWFFPLPRPKGASGPEKLADALEAARFEVLTERRADPLYRPRRDEAVGLFLAQVRTIRRLSASRPAMGQRQVFIVADAELLVPQEASDEAANALLKVLEEPGSGTTFILTAHDPDALLPTLRSRLLPVRLRPLDASSIATFLRQRARVDPDTAGHLARLGRGSIGRALSFLSSDDGLTPAEEARAHALEWLEAALDPAPTRRFVAALGQRPTGARGAFADSLDALALWLRDLAAVTVGADGQVIELEAMERLRELSRRVHAERIPAAIQLVETARDLGRINANPQLTLAWVLNRLARSLPA